MPFLSFDQLAYATVEQLPESRSLIGIGISLLQEDLQMGGKRKKNGRYSAEDAPI